MLTNRMNQNLIVRRIVVAPLIFALLAVTLFGLPGVARADFSYPVKAGDNLSKIARNNSTTVDALVQANKAKYPCLATNASCLQIGWTLTIPSSAGGTAAGSTVSNASTYTVQSGDSLAKIAKKLGVDFNELIAANKKEHACLAAATPCALQVGWVLNVPGAAAAAPVPVEDPVAVVAAHVEAFSNRDFDAFIATLDPALPNFNNPETRAKLRTTFATMAQHQISVDVWDGPTLTVTDGNTATVFCGILVYQADIDWLHYYEGNYYLTNRDGHWKISNADSNLP